MLAEGNEVMRTYKIFDVRFLASLTATQTAYTAIFFTYEQRNLWIVKKKSTDTASSSLICMALKSTDSKIKRRRHFLLQIQKGKCYISLKNRGCANQKKSCIGKPVGNHLETQTFHWIKVHNLL